MRLAITIFSPVIFIFVSVMTLAICTSSHIITKPEGRKYHIAIVILELLIYYFAFLFTKKWAAPQEA